jgi:hypothetical protein
MSDWDYHDIRIVGDENELMSFCEHYILNTNSGKTIFVYNPCDIESKQPDPEEYYYGDANLFHSSDGHLIYIKIWAQTKYRLDNEIIFNLQGKYKGLIFYADIISDICPLSEVTAFTRIQKGEVCIGVEGIPIVDERTDKEPEIWCNYFEGSYAFGVLKEELDNDIRNFRHLKLGKIFGSDTV